MKIIERNFPWTKKTKWSWPDNDSKLIQVIDHVSDINRIMKHVDGNELCVQAGGACGLWPYRLADFFECVFTFEPDLENYQCLELNIKGKDNIVANQMALSNTSGSGSIQRHQSELDNVGAGYFEPGSGDVNCISLDSFNIESCDLIQLDIEGHELEAIEGAAETIKRCRPVIVIEEKQLPQMSRDYKLPRILLESFGYREVDRVHRDVIFKG